MAINPETQYPGKINASDANYPYGSARNITTPGDGTGTPWEAALVNDIMGFQQALLDAGGVVPSGSPDTVPVSQYMEALRKIAGKLTDGKKYQFFAAALRNTGGGWAFINDATHEPVGFDGISVVGGNITLDYTNADVKEVGALLVVPDETLSKLGIIAGSSVGLTSATIQMQAPIEFLLDTATATITAPAHWGSSITAALVDNRCTVTHPSEVSTDQVPTAVPVGFSPDFVRTRAAVSYNATQLTFAGVQNASGFVSYNGASWDYVGEMKNAPGFNFVGNELVVTHDETDPTDISVTTRSNGHIANVDSVSVGSFQVQFFNYSGTQILVPDTSMKFFFSREGQVESDLISGEWTCRRGYATIDANDLVSASGNLWVIGVSEVN